MRKIDWERTTMGIVFGASGVKNKREEIETERGLIVKEEIPTDTKEDFSTEITEGHKFDMNEEKERDTSDNDEAANVIIPENIKVIISNGGSAILIDEEGNLYATDLSEAENFKDMILFGYMEPDGKIIQTELKDFLPEETANKLNEMNVDLDKLNRWEEFIKKKKRDLVTAKEDIKNALGISSLLGV